MGPVTADLASLAGPTDEELAAIEGLADYLAQEALAAIGRQLLVSGADRADVDWVVV